MPNIKSAKKRVKVTAVKEMQNKVLKTSLKTVMKKYKTAVETGDKEQAGKAYLEAVKQIDKAVAKGIIHKNNAARKKSQFTLLLNKVG